MQQILDIMNQLAQSLATSLNRGSTVLIYVYHATISNDFPNADSIALFVCQLQYCISCQVKLKNGFQHFPPVFDIQDLEVRDYQNGDLFPGNYVFI